MKIPYWNSQMGVAVLVSEKELYRVLYAHYVVSSHKSDTVSMWRYDVMRFQCIEWL